ncbi:hypothetical protein [Halorussus caseinilyticus]|nr:hypothetical protein [Halorussus sp. DT72]
MPDERESPSAGWREVYREMEAATNAEDATRPCPDCGRTCRNVLRDVYECPDHGVFRASGARSDASRAGGSERDGGESGRSDAEEGGRSNAEEGGGSNAEEDDDRERRTRGSAGRA